MIRSKLGKRVFYLPECYSPQSLDPAMADPADPIWATDICIAGNLYAYRVALFQQLVDHDMKIWGLPAPPWMRTGDLTPKLQNRYVAHADKARAFCGAKIVLNTLNPSEIWGTNVRTFEACGAGAFQIVDWRPGLEHLFEIGKEVEIFTDTNDLLSKIDFYLAAPEERIKIAQAGHSRAFYDHTYRVRLGQLLDVVEGRSSGYPEPAPAWQGPGN
jgi:spore maturation protein CgeB